MCARRFLGCIVVLTLIVVAGAFAIYQWGGRALISQAVPQGHFEAAKADGAPDYVQAANWLAISITRVVGTMWCAYAFAGLALVSLPAAIRGGTATLIAWIAQTFLQLVLLSIIMVGQKVAAAKSDRQLEQTYKDAEALLKISDEIQTLLKQNTSLTEEIHQVVRTSKNG